MPKVSGTPGAPAAGTSEAKARKPRANPGPGSYKRKPKPSKPEVAASDTLETGKNLTTGQWLDVIDFVKSHPDMTQEAVCAHFRSKGWKLKQGTLSKNLKREDQLRQQALATSNGPNTKRARIVTCPEVERALLLWFRAMEERGESPTGAMLVEKRRRFEIAMDIPPERRLSGEGWVASFKKAYGIREHRRHGEAGSVDLRDVAQERERMRPIIAQYAPAAVRAEMAGPTAADEAEESEDEGKDEPIPPSEMLALCDRLLAGCRDHAVGNLLDLTKELMTVKHQMRALQATTVKQTSLTTFWKPVTRPADAGGSPSAADSPIVLD